MFFSLLKYCVRCNMCYIMRKELDATISPRMRLKILVWKLYVFEASAILLQSYYTSFLS